MLLTYNFDIDALRLFTLLCWQGLLERTNIYGTPLEQIHQLGDFGYHAQIVTLHGLFLTVLYQLRLLVFVCVVLESAWFLLVVWMRAAWLLFRPSLVGSPPLLWIWLGWLLNRLLTWVVLLRSITKTRLDILECLRSCGPWSRWP